MGKRSLPSRTYIATTLQNRVFASPLEISDSKPPVRHCLIMASSALFSGCYSRRRGLVGSLSMHPAAGFKRVHFWRATVLASAAEAGARVEVPGEPRGDVTAQMAHTPVHREMAETARLGRRFRGSQDGFKGIALAGCSDGPQCSGSGYFSMAPVPSAARVSTSFDPRLTSAATGILACEGEFLVAGWYGNSWRRNKAPESKTCAI